MADILQSSPNANTGFMIYSAMLSLGKFYYCSIDLQTYLKFQVPIWNYVRYNLINYVPIEVSNPNVLFRFMCWLPFISCGLAISDRTKLFKFRTNGYSNRSYTILHYFIHYNGNCSWKTVYQKIVKWKHNCQRRYWK